MVGQQDFSGGFRKPTHWAIGPETKRATGTQNLEEFIRDPYVLKFTISLNSPVIPPAQTPGGRPVYRANQITRRVSLFRPRWRLFLKFFATFAPSAQPFSWSPHFTNYFFTPSRDYQRLALQLLNSTRIEGFLTVLVCSKRDGASCCVRRPLF